MTLGIYKPAVATFRTHKLEYQRDKMKSALLNFACIFSAVTAFLIDPNPSDCNYLDILHCREDCISRGVKIPEKDDLEASCAESCIKIHSCPPTCTCNNMWPSYHCRKACLDDHAWCIEAFPVCDKACQQINMCDA